MKTTHRRIISLVVLIGIIGAIGFLFIIKQQQDENSRNQLQTNLETAITQYHNGEISVIDFSTLTSFSWDRLYFFGPYTPPYVIETVLGTYWLGSRFTQTESSENYTLLVFTRNGHVVQNLEFWRGDGDFSYLDSRSGYASKSNFYAIDEAKFVIDKRGRVIWQGER